jgi:hypothetical protein
MHKGSNIYVILVLNEKGVTKHIEHLLVVRMFADTLPKDLPRMMLERGLEFTIDVKLGTEPIARRHYRMLTPELQELKMKLKELLDLGIIRLCVSPWGVPVIFIQKKDGSLRLYMD